jgi:hypothetical protein
MGCCLLGLLCFFSFPDLFSSSSICHRFLGKREQEERAKV